MAQPKKAPDRPAHIPEHLIETVNKVVRASRQMLPEIGREPTLEELAEKLALPREKVDRLIKIAKQPIRVEAESGDDEVSPPG